jgi:hypothetical protein
VTGAPAMDGCAPEPVCLVATADELDALARRLGADRFPGVRQSVFDRLPAEHHEALADGFVATLRARGLVADGTAGPELMPAAALLLDPVVTGPVRYAVHRVENGRESGSIIAVGRGGEVVRHRTRGDLHRFDLLGTGGDAAAALSPLLALPDTAAVPTAARPAGRPRPVPQSQLSSSLPPMDSWHAVSLVQRVDDVDGTQAAVAVSWLAVVDARPAALVTVEPTDADGMDPDTEQLLVVVPTDVPAISRRLAAWCGAGLPSSAAG